jgi:phosphoenolpyruvate synthase/pyruvate phosphate dikinase
MDIIKPFGKLSKRDTLLAGGKGASLGEMTQAGIPVPEGFVVLSKAFDRFIEETSLVADIDAILHSVNLKEVHTVEDASEKIHALILGADMPKDIASEIKKAFSKLGAKLVAVRSSATAEDSSTAAWAGQLDTYLNTSGKTLLENVKECWASLFTPRAIVYRIEKKLHKSKISVAVIVQRMIQSEVSGVAFSVHPVTQDKNQIIIEAGFGLGEAVVSGAITPDSYVVEKKENSLLSKSVEFQKRMLVRSRKGGNKWQELTRAKGERQVLADKHILELSKFVSRIERHYGFPVDIEWAHEGGKFYILQSRPITTLIKAAGVQKTGEEPVLQRLKSLSWGHWLDRPYPPFITSMMYRGVAPEYFSRIGLDGFGYISNLYQYPDLYQSEKLAKANLERLSSYFKKHSISDLSRLLEKTHAENMREVNKVIKSKSDPISKLRRIRENLCLYYPFLWIIDPLEKHYQGKIDSLVPKYIKGDVQKWVGDATIPEQKNAYILMQEALRKDPVEKVQKEFGWLKSRDGFTDFYTIDELNEIKSHLKDIKTHEVKVKIPSQLKSLVDELKELSFFRADRTDKYYELLGLCRPIFQEVAESLGIPFKDLAFYDVESIFAGNPKKISIPFSFLYLDGKQYFSQDKFIEFAKEAEDEIKGISAYLGKAKGIVKIIKHPSELGKINEGDILVAQMTFPAFISAMHKASAFVTDEGSITCHAAIVAREMKKPCIIGTKIATKVLKDGDLVEVDANKGIVRILEKGGEEEKLNAQIWQNSIRWKYDAWPFFTSVYMLLAEKPKNKYYTQWQFVSCFHDGGLEAYIPKKELIDEGNAIIRELVNGNDNYYKELKKVSDDMQRTMKLCMHYSKKGNIEDINSWWLPVKRTLSEVGNIIFSFDFALSEFLEDMKISAPEDFEALSSNIVEPKKSFIAEAGILLKKLVVKHKGDFNRVHPEFVDKFGWFQNSYKGVSNIDKNWVENYYKQNKEKTRLKSEHKIQRLDKKYSLLAKTSSFAISFRDNKKKLLLLAVDVMEKWLKTVCKTHNLSFEDMKWLSVDEVLDIIKNKNSENISRAYRFNSEKIRYGLMSTENYGDIPSKLFEEIRTLHTKNIGTGELRGFSANKGIVRGKAKIILDPKREGHKLEKGDILVTSMTRPEYLPLMNIAGAFVTDEGGVTCHAAIVARETGKPCITGTKFATQILNDGDIIEVDADKGIVRIIKKA